MRDRYPGALAVEKFQQRVAEIIVVITGPLIAVLVGIQFWRGLDSAKDGVVTSHADPFSYILLYGILGCIGLIAFIISIATARNLFRRHRETLKSRKG